MTKEEDSVVILEAIRNGTHATINDVSKDTGIIRWRVERAMRMIRRKKLIPPNARAHARTDGASETTTPSDSSVRHSSDGTTDQTSPPDDVSELNRRLSISEARVTALLNELSAQRAAAHTTGVVGEAVGGRQSLAAFRNETWSRFAATVMDLPRRMEAGGYSHTYLLMSATLLADLHTLELSPPMSKMAARDRDRVRRMLVDEAFFSNLAHPGRPWDKMRAMFLQEVARCFYRPSVTQLFARSVDIPPMPNMMGYGESG